MFSATFALILGLPLLFGVLFEFANDSLEAREPLPGKIVPIRASQRKVKKIDPTTVQNPLANIMRKSSEEADKLLEGKTNAELYELARELREERLFGEASFLVERILSSENATEFDKARAVDLLSGFYDAVHYDDPNERFVRFERVLEETLASSPDSWRVKTAVALAYSRLPYEGSFVDGRFVYGMRGDSEPLSTAARFHVRKLQLLRDALPLVRQEVASDSTPEDIRLKQYMNVDRFYQVFIQELYASYYPFYSSGTWRLQALTDLDVLPDYEPIVYGRRNRNSGAPVDAEGAPVFFLKPESFETAKNDGERIQALRFERFEATSDSNVKFEILMERANDACSLYGVETLRSYNYFFNDDPTPESNESDGVWSLQTLEDSETIAKLATGVKRFKLPEEYDYIALWRESLEYAADGYSRWRAWSNVAREYENRRQLDKAIEARKAAVDSLVAMETEAGNQPYAAQLEEARIALSQIVDPRVRFDIDSCDVAGMKAELGIKFRNATQVELTAKRLNVGAMLRQLRSENFWKTVKNAYMNSIQQRLTELLLRESLEGEGDLQKRQYLETIKPLDDGEKMIGEEVARFSVDLEPDPQRFTRVKSVELPTLAPGAYLIEAKAKDGNRDAIVVWLRDTAIMKKALKDETRYYFLDSATGRPLANTEVEFFDVTTKGRDVKTKTRKAKTDSDGSIAEAKTSADVHRRTLTIMPSRDANSPSQTSFMDFDSVWYSSYDPWKFQQLRAFFVSDRPIYRPKQKAEFKVWVGNAQYDAPEKNEWANREISYQIISPKGEKVKQERVTLDEYGGFAGSYEIPDDATLGVYVVQFGRNFDANGEISNYLGDGSFRLEEYRKPEFQVNVDAPKEPVALGDKFKATVEAKYYFGAPVTNATVSYKVIRSNYRSRYFPPRYWDWFYGPGYWQFAYDCLWYPGWKTWGVCRLPGFWDSREYGVPEIVSEGEAAIGADGKFEIEIDSSLAKIIYPNDDQKYEIEAEVVDQSRRTIVGKGSVYAARKPFQTYVWFERGFYKVGDKATARFQARRLDEKPVVGTATVKLYKVEYAPSDDGAVKPIETEVFSKVVETDENGTGSVDFKAVSPGQYRLSCVVETDSELKEEGGQLIVVRGDRAKYAVDKKTAKEEGRYRFNALEIIPEKPEYSVGETAKIQLASDNPNALAIVFTRAQNGVALDKPQFVQLQNGLGSVELKIEQGDQPNIFVEATTVYDGKLYDELKEIVVPPEKRVLDVAVEPVKERVRPGERAKIKLRLTDVDGKPVVGQTVATIYDKSLEYVSGGSNVPDIREFFWKWRRNSHKWTSTNLDRLTIFDAFSLVYATSDYRERLQNVGAFGGMDVMLSMSAAPLGGAAMGSMDGGMAMKSRGAKAMMTLDSVAADDMEFAEEEAASAPTMAAMEAPAMARGAAPAFSARREAMSMSAAMEDKAENGASSESVESGALVEATVRKNLADLAYWAADLKPDDDGVIEIEVDMPENLTTWKIAAWSVGDGLRVGSGESEIITSKDVVVRMQKPRFLTQKDEVVLSANVHNYLGSEKEVLVSLEFPQEESDNSTAKLSFLDESTQTRKVVVPANGETRVDWVVRAETFGTATLLMKALTNEESDAIQDVITVKEHGIDKQIAVSGVIAASEKKEAKDAENAQEDVRESRFTLTIPEERRVETTKLTVRFSPTLAGAIFDALPYLNQYPYGCTEQTLNRFLPTVVAQKALQDAGVDLSSLKNKKANLNAQELGDASERAKQWRRNPLNDPVFDIDEARKMASLGVERLTSMQNSDGGWGWFYGAYEHSSPHLTALVARGLNLARECDQVVDASVIERGASWLRNYEREQARRALRGKVWTDEWKREKGRPDWKANADATDAFVYYALDELGLRSVPFEDEFVNYETGEFSRELDDEQVHSIMKELLWEARNQLSLYPLANYALALCDDANDDANAQARVATILSVLAQYRGVDDENQTVCLDLNRFDGWYFWRWYDSEFETQAAYLRLLQRVDSATLKELGLDKDAPGLVKYLLNNRKNATYWNSTRDTALCVEAFSEYLAKTNELAPSEKVEVFVDGELKKVAEYTSENLFETDGTLELNADELTTGEHEVVLRVSGDGALYYNAYLEFFTLEDPIQKAGLELKTERRYYKLVERKNATTQVEGGRGQVVEQRVERYDRVPLATGDEVVSGDLIEVELIVDSKNDYESILLEDAKAAGFEPIEQQSGYNGNALRAYVEYRDDRVCFFASQVPKGRTTVNYRLRAETPGKFSALPTKIWAMYAPELKGNADEFKANVKDK